MWSTEPFSKYTKKEQKSQTILQCGLCGFESACVHIIGRILVFRIRRRSKLSNVYESNVLRKFCSGGNVYDSVTTKLGCLEPT